MNNWLAFRGLFFCTAMVVVMGAAMGILIIRDQNSDEIYQELHRVSYDIPAEGKQDQLLVMAAQKFVPGDGR